MWTFWLWRCSSCVSRCFSMEEIGDGLMVCRECSVLPWSILRERLRSALALREGTQ